MADRPAALLKQLARDVPEPGTPLHGRDPRRLVKGDVVHAVQLQHQVPVLAAEAEVGVAVPAALGRDPDAVVAAASDGGLDVLRCERDGDGDGDERDADVEWGAVEGPLRAVPFVVGDAGGGEAVFDNCSFAQRRAGSEWQDGQEESCDCQHGGGVLLVS